MVASGPMPGSTPTMLPTRTPMKHHSRLCGSSATPKPYQRSWRACAIMASMPPAEDRERDVQQVGEQQRAEHRNAERQQCRAFQRGGAVAERGHEHAGEGRGSHAADLAEDDEQDRSGNDAGPAQPLRML